MPTMPRQLTAYAPIVGDLLKDHFMINCKKTYSDIPFAHRQHLHDGHCSLIHGHNWSFTLTFSCIETDKNGFVIDFGKLGQLKDWIEEKLDHACLFNADDPEIEGLITRYGFLFKVYIIPNCSSEGIAKHLHEIFDPMVRKQTNDRAWVAVVEVKEDSKNSACYSLE